MISISSALNNTPAVFAFSVTCSGLRTHERRGDFRLGNNPGNKQLPQGGVVRVGDRPYFLRQAEHALAVLVLELALERLLSTKNHDFVEVPEHQRCYAQRMGLRESATSF
ncbi:MAG: hypothetical protein HYZ00_13535 [Candidatus Hydrogenedentes bacterium]|nr:hypothetical protein [Candidatus Hydrogenedentota bacterium]